jgi:hypothetical protein
VLPASGVALTWLLTMTLLLPVVDYARSTRPLVQHIARFVPAGECIRAPDLSPTHLAGLEVFGGYAVDAAPQPRRTCRFLLVMTRTPSLAAPPSGWTELARIRRPVDGHEYFTLYRLAPSGRALRGDRIQDETGSAGWAWDRAAPGSRAAPA